MRSSPATWRPWLSSTTRLSFTLCAFIDSEKRTVISDVGSKLSTRAGPEITTGGVESSTMGAISTGSSRGGVAMNCSRTTSPVLVLVTTSRVRAMSIWNGGRPGSS